MEDFKNIEQKLAKLSKTTREIAFHKEDKNVLRNELEAYTKEYSLGADQGVLRVHALRVLKGALVGLTGVILAGGTAAYAAEDALPGQSLYSVKVNFNEKMRSLAAVSDEAEARLQAQLAERRIEEVGRLAAQGELSAEEEQELQARFQKHSEASEASLRKIEGVGRNETVAEIQSEFEATITAHENLLAQFAREESSGNVAASTRAELSEIIDDVASSSGDSQSEATSSEENGANTSDGDGDGEDENPTRQDSSKMQPKEESENEQSADTRNQIENLTLPENENSADINNILDWLHSEREEISKKRGDSEEKLWQDVTSQVEELTAKTQSLAQARVGNAKDALRANRDELSPSVRTEVERYISIAEKDIEQGVRALNEEQYSEGFQTLRTAMRRALQAQALIRTSLEFDSYTKLEEIENVDLQANLEAVLNENKTQDASGEASTSDRSSNTPVGL